MVESGKGLPNFARATPPISFSSSSKSWPKPLATSSRTQMAWDVTSGPIPSPGREVTRSCMNPPLLSGSIYEGRPLWWPGSGRSIVVTTRGYYTSWSHPPEIVFLLAVRIGDGDRRPAEPVGRRRTTRPGLRLAGAAGYVSRMRVIAIASGGSGGGTREGQSGRGGRKLLALAGVVSAADVAAVDAASAHVLDQFEQMAVLNLLNAVGKNHKLAIDLIEFAALELVSQLFA